MAFSFTHQIVAVTEMDMNYDNAAFDDKMMTYKCMVTVKPAFSSTLKLLKLKHKCIESQIEDRVRQPAVSLVHSWPTLDGTAGSRLSCIQGWMWVVLQKPK